MQLAATLAFTAEPIWSGANGSRYVLLRRVIEFSGSIRRANISVTAAQSGTMEKLLGSYRLYVGGAAVGIGPGRGNVRTAYYPHGGDVNHTFFDSFDVTPHAQRANGTLVLGLQCYHSSGDEGAGVLLAAQLTFTNGSMSIIGSSSIDGRWLTFDATAAYGPTSATGSYGAPQEWVQSGLMPSGWTRPGFAPSSMWLPPASRRGMAPSLAPGVLSAKPTLPLALETDVAPQRIVRLGNGTYFIDFGSALQGGLNLRLDAAHFPVGTKAVVTLGEELVGDHRNSTTVLYPMRTGNRYRNTWTVTASPLDGVTVFEHHEYMLFRYASVAITPHVQPSQHTLDVRAWRVHYPWHGADSTFASSDATLNAVWRLCRDTLRVTSLDTATDSNTRERLPYEADGYITGLSRLALQAEYAWPRHSWLHTLYNPTWPTEWRQTAALMAHADFMATGELELHSRFAEALSAQTQRACVNASTHLVDFSSCTRKTGGMGWGHEAKLVDIVDWPQVYRDGYQLTNVNTVVNSFAVGGLRALANMVNASGNVSGAQTLDAVADEIAAAVNTLLWDSKHQLYHDGLDATGRPVEHTAWHASVFAAAFGLVPHERWPALLAYFRRRGMVGSVYASFYFLQALYLAPDHGTLALEMMTSRGKHSWWHMLQVGATATMEAWSTDEKPNLSWSHPWASAPASAVVWGLFGIRPMTPGWRSIEVRPQPGTLRWATIRVPSARGAIEASFNRTTARFALSLHTPHDVAATVCLPSLGETHASLLVNKAPTQGTLAGDFVCVSLLKGGAPVWVMRLTSRLI